MINFSIFRDHHSIDLKPILRHNPPDISLALPDLQIRNQRRKVAYTIIKNWFLGVFEMGLKFLERHCVKALKVKLEERRGVGHSNLNCLRSVDKLG